MLSLSLSLTFSWSEETIRTDQRFLGGFEIRRLYHPSVFDPSAHGGYRLQWYIRVPVYQDADARPFLVRENERKRLGKSLVTVLPKTPKSR